MKIYDSNCYFAITNFVLEIQLPDFRPAYMDNL